MIGHTITALFSAAENALFDHADFEAEAVGAKIHSGQTGTILHTNGKGVRASIPNRPCNLGCTPLAVKHFHPMTRPSWVNMLCVT